MPGRDGSGPLGRGAATGRGMGYCPGFYCVPFGAGRRLGLGLGYRRGYRRFDQEELEPRSPKELLEEEKKVLQKRLEFLDKQLDSIANKDE